MSQSEVDPTTPPPPDDQGDEKPATDATPTDDKPADVNDDGK